MTFAGHHDVVRLKIAMDDARRVSFRESFRDMLQITQKLWQTSLLSVYQFAQGVPVDKLHRDEVHAIVLANLVDVRDVRMIERRGSLGFLGESTHAILI